MLEEAEALAAELQTLATRVAAPDLRISAQGRVVAIEHGTIINRRGNSPTPSNRPEFRLEVEIVGVDRYFLRAIWRRWNRAYALPPRATRSEMLAAVERVMSELRALASRGAA